MTRLEFDILMDSAVAGGYCPVCGSGEIDTSGYCAKHRNPSLWYSTFLIGWAEKRKISNIKTPK